MRKQPDPHLRPAVESFEAIDAKFYLEDWETLSRGISLKINADDRFRISRNRRRWITPLLRGLAGLNQPVQGKCLINGNDIAQFSFEEFNPFRANIGFSFALPTLLSNRTLRENLQMPILYNWEKTPQEAIAITDEIEEYFVISSFMELRPTFAPVSVCKIVSIMRAFIRSPQFVILDDPLFGLEQRAQHLMAMWFKRLIAKKPDLGLLIGSDDSSLDEILSLKSASIEETSFSQVDKFGGKKTGAA